MSYDDKQHSTHIVSTESPHCIDFSLDYFQQTINIPISMSNGDLPIVKNGHRTKCQPSYCLSVTFSAKTSKKGCANI